MSTVVVRAKTPLDTEGGTLFLLEDRRMVHGVALPIVEVGGKL